MLRLLPITLKSRLRTYICQVVSYTVALKSGRTLWHHAAISPAPSSFSRSDQSDPSLSTLPKCAWLICICMCAFVRLWASVKARARLEHDGLAYPLRASHLRLTCLTTREHKSRDLIHKVLLALGDRSNGLQKVSDAQVKAAIRPFLSTVSLRNSTR